MSEAIESTLVKVPFEALKRTTRDRKYAIDELKETLHKVKAVAVGSSSKTTPPSRDAALDTLNDCLRTIRHLKRKLDGASAAEREDAQRCCTRLEHLKELGRPPRDGHIEWNRARIDRLLVDYMLRGGNLESAAELVRRAGLGELTDLHIFAAAQTVLTSLRQHQCAEALAWCAENSARLRKVRSPLEFRLRIQEFVELLRKGQVTEAIVYARRHLALWSEQYPSELQRASALLAFSPDTACLPYAGLLSNDRWQDLIELFKSELFRLHSLPPASLLEVHLQAGLSALKTPQSLATGCTTDDPLHLPHFQKLAEGLPWAKHVHSKLICAISGEVMSEHNPPMVLPNGYVYSQSALMKMAEGADGIITCPVAGAIYHVSDLRRAFVM